MHGKTDSIHHDGEGLFAGLPNPFQATRYHSLIIQPDTLSDDFVVCAWSVGPGNLREIMGVRHRQWPLFGVQFHPESFLTEHGSESADQLFTRAARHGGQQVEAPAHGRGGSDDLGRRSARPGAGPCAGESAAPVAGDRSLGLVLAEEIASDVDSPPHDKSLVDGYAVFER